MLKLIVGGSDEPHVIQLEESTWFMDMLDNIEQGRYPFEKESTEVQE